MKIGWTLNHAQLAITGERNGLFLLIKLSVYNILNVLGGLFNSNHFKPILTFMSTLRVRAWLGIAVQITKSQQ